MPLPVNQHLCRDLCIQNCFHNLFVISAFLFYIFCLTNNPVRFRQVTCTVIYIWITMPFNFIFPFLKVSLMIPSFWKHKRGSKLRISCTRLHWKPLCRSPHIQEASLGGMGELSWNTFLKIRFESSDRLPMYKISTLLWFHQLNCPSSLFVGKD